MLEPERFELQEGPIWIFSVDRRQFLAALGAGFVVAMRAEAQQNGGGTLEARLHVGGDGIITVLNGKVEEGQGAKAELAAAAAEELRLPLSQVRVTMADTRLTPNDGITAGSRTTPQTVPAVRRAAAALRELKQTLESRAGKTLSYEDVVRASEWKSANPSGTLTDAADWKVLGKPAIRIDAREIVTGALNYPSDIQRPGMLYGAMLRPASYGAKLDTLDESGAKELGVTVVRDGDFVGCVAPSSFLARKGVAALKATWKEKQHSSSKSLFADLKASARDGRPSGNESATREALKAAESNLKATYQAAYIQHAPMEPRAAVAEWSNGTLTVWTGTSQPFGVRDSLAEAFRIPPASVRVIVPDFGGGFGGKHTGEAAIEAAKLAQAAGKPVHVRWTRPEEFTWAYARPAALIEAEAALDKDGGIAAWNFVNYNSGTSGIDSPYRSSQSHIVYRPSESPLRQGSYRALASTANNFARECLIDELAAAAGKDPLAFRLKNLNNDRIRAVLEAATAKFGWEKKVKAKRPVGLACGTEKNSVVAACVEIEVDPKTGVPKLVEICQAFECGAILNPANLQAQVEGCIVMGLGAVMGEELRFENGRITNARFAQYRVPRFHDLPKMDIVLVDRKDAEPVGAGETPLIAVAPAMANAYFKVTGKRIRSLPFVTSA